MVLPKVLIQYSLLKILVAEVMIYCGDFTQWTGGDENHD